MLVPETLGSGFLRKSFEFFSFPLGFFFSFYPGIFLGFSGSFFSRFDLVVNSLVFIPPMFVSVSARNLEVVSQFTGGPKVVCFVSARAHSGCTLVVRKYSLSSLDDLVQADVAVDRIHGVSDLRGDHPVVHGG